MKLIRWFTLIILVALLAVLLFDGNRSEAQQPGSSKARAEEPTVQTALTTAGPGSLHVRLPGVVDRSTAPPAVQLKAQEWITLLSENFEGAFPGSTWTLAGNPTWGRTNYRSHGGSFSAYCAAGGPNPISPPGPYANNMSGWMIYGPFNLSQATDAEIHFFHYTTTQPYADYFWVVGSVDAYNWVGTKFAGPWVATCNDWCEYTLSLTDLGALGNLCGQPQVWIGFIFQTDAATQYEGTYLDDITLQAFGVAQPTATRTPTRTRTPTPTRTRTPTGMRRVYLPAILKRYPAYWCDAYEPNNDRTTANPGLISGYQYRALLCFGDPDDYYYIDATLNPIRIDLSVPAAVDYDLYLYREGIQPAVSSSKNQGNGADEHIEYTPTASGRYYIRVSPYQDSRSDSEQYTLVARY